MYHRILYLKDDYNEMKMKYTYERSEKKNCDDSLPIGQWLTLFVSDLQAYFCGCVLYCQSNNSWNCSNGVAIGILWMIRPSVDDIGACGDWKSAPASIIKTFFSFNPAAIVRPAVPPPTKKITHKINC